MTQPKTRPVRIEEAIQRQFAAECKRRGLIIQDAATEALCDKMDAWEREAHAAMVAKAKATQEQPTGDEWQALQWRPTQPQEPTDD